MFLKAWVVTLLVTRIFGIIGERLNLSVESLIAMASQTDVLRGFGEDLLNYEC